jgi:hypothetical protein
MSQAFRCRRLLPCLALPASAALLLACSGEAPDATLSTDGLIVLAEESRYRIVSRSVSPEAASRPGELVVSVAASGGWHVEPEAPTQLELESSGVRLEPSAFANEDARVLDSGGFEFAAAIHAEAPGEGHARGQVKFGICEGPDEKCVIVRREVEIPLRVVFAD